LGVTGTFHAALVVVTLASLRTSEARADEIPSPTAGASEVFVPPETYQPSQPKPPYTAPFQLRGVIPKNGVRIDTTLGLYHAGNSNAQVTVMLLSGQWRVFEPLALQVRWGIDSNQTGNAASRTGMLNPTVGALIGTALGSNFRLAWSVTIGLPIATGGGDNAEPEQAALQRQGALARSAMDNTSFAVNDVGFPTGMSLAYLKGGVTAQIDATVIPSVRMKAENTQPDSSKVNSTYGFFLGYLLVHELSLGIELRYQRFLSTPAAVAKDESTRDNLSLAFGPRFVLDLTDTVSMRPAVTYGHGLRGPISEQSFQLVQLDIPISF
jgi:hypothetical protein